jgi:prephenate dehydratase
VLQLFDTFKINLTKIQSLPVVGKPWQYAFFIDVLFEDHKLFSEVITILENVVKDLKLLGVYRDNKNNNQSKIMTNIEFSPTELI